MKAITIHAIVRKVAIDLLVAKRLLVWMVICCGLVFCAVAAQDSNGETPAIVTNLHELAQRGSTEESRNFKVHIEASVWWSSETEGRVILKDDTAALQVELDLPCQIPALGDLVVLDGVCTTIQTRDVIKLSGVPVVDHDGLHPPELKTGSIHLKAGLHPLRVAWFNRSDRVALEVHFEGPDLPRQKISDEMLFYQHVNSTTGTTNLIKGLEYQFFEGQSWYLLPNFHHLPAVTNGVVENFDVSVRTRDNNVGLQYSGFIDVPQDGQYTFCLLSDDGSRLFIGDSSLKVETLAGGMSTLPEPMQMAETQVKEPEYQWSEIEGSVVSFIRSRLGLEIDLMTDEGAITLRVSEDSVCSHTLRPQNRIRAAGVSRKLRSLAGQPTQGELYVQRWRDINQLTITPTIWDEYPLVDIGSLQPGEPSSVAGSIVRLKGIASLSGVDQSTVLEDGTGRIVLSDIAFKDLGRGALEVLGRVVPYGSEWVLHCTEVRALEGSESGAANLPVLTTAEQICQLSHEEAARGYPVRVQGVITSTEEFDGGVLHDASRGIFVTTWDLSPIQVGDYCEIEGVTAPFGFDPYIQATKLRKLGKGVLPVPIQPTWDQLINGTLHCNYVELEGIVASVKNDAIDLLMRDGRLHVSLNPSGPAMPSDSLGATVRLRGALLHDWDAESHRLVVGNMSLDQQVISTIHPAPADPFDMPLKRIGDLLQFDPQAGALTRVKVSGQLVCRDEQTSYLMDDEHGLRFNVMKPIDVQLGDLLEVVGFPELSGPSPLLRSAVARRIGWAELPAPRKPHADAILRADYDSTRVQLEGVLLGVSKRSDGIVLEMQNGNRRFIAVMRDLPHLVQTLIPGSHLELTGVYIGKGGSRELGRPIDSFELIINFGSDIRVLSRPPLWTLKRLVLVVGLLLGVLAASLIWINLLHRKVEDRTQQLGEQIRQRQQVEHQRAIEQERSRLAHDLHDDLGAGLTEVNMLSSLVKNQAIPVEKKNSYADKMSELACSMVTSLDVIVWGENPRNDTVSSLADYFESYAHRLLEPASVGCIFNVATDVPEHPLGPRFRQELFLAFKEAISNVLKHAEASEVRLEVSVDGDELVVKVSDDGCGILSDTHEAGADGLVNMQERLAALGGSCEIQSDPTKGTTVRMRAPIQRLVA